MTAAIRSGAATPELPAEVQVASQLPVLLRYRWYNPLAQTSCGLVDGLSISPRKAEILA